MKTFLAAAALFAFTATPLIAGDAMPAPKSHAMLESMKQLVGTWETEAKGQKVRTVIRTVANGSAIEETLMPDSMAMVNMIHADGDGLMMTHYCAGASQPRYRATKADGNRIVFSFVDGSNLGASYMKGVTVVMVDANHMTQEWTNLKADGKEEQWKFEFTRVK